MGTLQISTPRASGARCLRTRRRGGRRRGRRSVRL